MVSYLILLLLTVFTLPCQCGMLINSSKKSGNWPMPKLRQYSLLYTEGSNVPFTINPAVLQYAETPYAASQLIHTYRSYCTMGSIVQSQFYGYVGLLDGHCFLDNHKAYPGNINLTSEQRIVSLVSLVV